VLPVLLAGASALVWGAADFCGGVASLRGKASLRDRALIVAVLAHVCALPAIVPLLFWVPGSLTGSAMLWGGAAGLASLAGIVALNLGLASGAMATVAPVAAVTAALVPLAGGLLTGDRPAFAALIGAVAAVGAIILVSGAWPTLRPAPRSGIRASSIAPPEARPAARLAIAPALTRPAAGSTADPRPAAVARLRLSGALMATADSRSAAMPSRSLSAGGELLTAAALHEPSGKRDGGGAAPAAVRAAGRKPSPGPSARPSARPSPRPSHRPTMTPHVLALALASGVAFGLFFLLLGRAGSEAGMWPLIADKAVSVGLGLAVLRACGVGGVSVPREVLLLGALAGSFDAIGTALYLMSSHHGEVSIVAPVAALYPASTVVLALIFNKERLRPVQCAGLGLAGVALLLVAS
jgi:drug/metabolite transporter (DMT)-like permease